MGKFLSADFQFQLGASIVQLKWPKSF